jgi:membrane fusion protein, copper/silver efflux system
MRALTKEELKKIKNVALVGGIFVLGIVSAKLLPSGSDKKSDSDQAMVEKVSDDSLKLSNETIKTLKISPVTFGNVPEQFSVMGKITVAEDRTAMVAARVSGRIDSVPVASGAELKVGQPLATLFSPDFIIAREEYLQTLESLKTSGDPEDKKMLGLARQKLQSMGVSPYDIDHLSSSDKTTQLIVRAPRAGAVIAKTAIVGNLVNPGDPLFTIGDTSAIWFAGDIYPTDLDKIHKGQQIIINPDQGGKPIEGKLSFISPMIDGTTRTIKIRAEMINPGSALRLDMFVRGNIILSTKEALTVPKASLVREGNGYICFKIMPNNIFQRVAVETAGESGDSFIISKGLVAGDQVVSDGALLLVSALTTSAAAAD